MSVGSDDDAISLFSSTIPQGKSSIEMYQKLHLLAEDKKRARNVVRTERRDNGEENVSSDEDMAQPGKRSTTKRNIDQLVNVVHDLVKVLTTKQATKRPKPILQRTLFLPITNAAKLQALRELIATQRELHQMAPSIQSHARLVASLQLMEVMVQKYSKAMVEDGEI